MADVKISREAWQFVVAALEATGQPWPPELAAVDFEWLKFEYAEGRRTRAAGRPFLQSRWRYTDAQVRGILNGNSAVPTPPGWVYFVQAGDHAIKIGFSRTENAEKRILSLQTSNALPLRFLGSRPGTLADEKALHRQFASDRMHGEWFRPSQAILNEIASLTTVEPGQSTKITQISDSGPESSELPARQRLNLHNQPKSPSSRMLPASARAPSSTTVEPAQPAGITQFTGSGPELQTHPVQQRSNLGNTAKSPSSQMPLLNTSIDLDRSQKEKEEGGGSAHTLGTEARTFLQVYTRWASDPGAPKRWRTPTPAALAWFLEEIMAAPDLIAGINVVVVLERWRDWLSTKAEAHGKPGTASGAKFPANWQNALRNWFINEKKFHRSQSGYAAGSVTTSATNAPTRPRRGEYTSSTDPRLQPPATPGDYEDAF